MDETLMVDPAQKSVGGIGGRKGKTNPIELIKAIDRFTIQFGEEDELIEDSMEEKLDKIKKLLARIDKLSDVETPRILNSNIIEIPLKESHSLGELDLTINRIEAMFPSATVQYVYKKVKEGKAKFYPTDEIIVSFLKPLDTKKLNILKIKFSLEVVKDFAGHKFLPKNTYSLRIMKGSKGNPLEITEKLLDDPDVVDANPNLLKVNSRIGQIEEEIVVRGDEVKNQWYLDSTSIPSSIIASSELRSDAGIEAKAAWDLLNGKAGDRKIVVAIIDTSFRLSHFALENSLITEIDKNDFDFVVPRSRREDAFKDPDGNHGTRCAGVLFANSPEEDFFGVAHGCSFLPVRIRENHTERQLLEVLEAVGGIADVISCSWAPDPDDSPVLNTALEEAFKNIAKSGGSRISKNGGRKEKGTVICFSAGNVDLPIFDENLVIDEYFINGVSQGSYNGMIRNPYAVLPNVIVVAASTSGSVKAPYSSYGKEVSVCAPSDNYPRDKKRIVLHRDGPGIWTTDLAESYTDRFGGTSCSTPLVAGVAALVLSANPNLTAKEVRTILEKTADQINKEDMDQSNVDGKYVEMRKRGRTRREHSIWYGYGKINARKAVQAAIDALPGNDR